MDRKFQMSNYFTSDDECAFIPYTTAGDLWDMRYCERARVQRGDARRREGGDPAGAGHDREAPGLLAPPTRAPSRCSGARSSGPSSTGSRSAFRCCSSSSASSPSASAGVGVANIMLVSVDERVREIGLRRALGARKRHIRLQFLAEALVLDRSSAGAAGIVLAYAITAAMPILPAARPALRGRVGQGRPAAAHLRPRPSSARRLILVFVGVALRPRPRPQGLAPRPGGGAAVRVMRHPRGCRRDRPRGRI